MNLINCKFNINTNIYKNNKDEYLLIIKEAIEKIFNIKINIDNLVSELKIKNKNIILKINQPYYNLITLYFLQNKKLNFKNLTMKIINNENININTNKNINKINIIF